MSDFLQEISINPLDLIVVVILAIFAISSYIKGFTAAALSLGAWIGAFVVTGYFAPTVIPHIEEMVQPDVMAFAVTYTVMFFVSLLLLKLVAGMFGKIIKNSDIGALDSAMGLLFGLFTGMLLISALYMITTPFISEKHQADWFQQAKSRPLIQYGASMISAMNPYFDELDFEETRKDIEALERMKKMIPSFPSKEKDKDEKKYKKENQEEMDKLFEKISKN